MQEPVLIVGGGAMACLFAAYLSAAGVPVSLLSEWEEGVAALNRDGVRLVNGPDSIAAYSVKATTRPEDIARHSLALVLVKSWQTRQAGEMLAACLAPHGTALTLQNGLGNLEALSGILGPQRTLCGSTTFGAALLAPGLVQAGGSGEIILPALPASRVFEDLFAACGLPVRTLADINSILWGKLVINAAINPLTALLDVHNGFLSENTHARQVVRALAVESSRVPAAGKITLPFTDPAAYVEQIIAQTAANSSSMRQDLRRGAPTEIEAITGQLISYGQRWGVETPLNSMVYHLIKARTG